MPAQGGVKFFPTCDLDYQVRAKSGEGQLTAACPHRGGFKFSPTCELDYLGFGLSQVRLYDLIRTAHSSMPTQGESDSLLRVR